MVIEVSVIITYWTNSNYQHCCIFSSHPTKTCIYITTWIYFISLNFTSKNAQKWSSLGYGYYHNLLKNPFNRCKNKFREMKLFMEDLLTSKQQPEVHLSSFKPHATPLLGKSKCFAPVRPALQTEPLWVLPSPQPDFHLQLLNRLGVSQLNLDALGLCVEWGPQNKPIL
jgi:hypothetical protein